VIRIIKRAATTRVADPLVEDAPKATLAPKEWEPADSIAWWAEHGVSPTTKPSPCQFCKGVFVKHCTDAEHAGCQNFQTAERRAKNPPPEKSKAR
jgi:hypothetical protein